MLTVSAIGSCRIFTPLNLMKRRGKIAVDHADAEWYTHSTEDVLQKVEIMRGAKPISPALLPLLVHGLEKYHAEAARPDFYGKTDVFVVEIASIKIYSADGWFLQQWCVRDALNGTITEPGSSEIAASADLKVQTKNDVIAGLRAIAEKLPAPVVFVPHVNVVRDDGTPVPERALVNEAMKEFCGTGAALMFDPTPYVYDAGYDIAMKDSGHYRGAFELVMGQKLVDFLNEHFAQNESTNAVA